MTPPVRYKHLMIDIETMGTSREAPVLAVGMVPFQLHREHCAVAPRELWWEGRLTLEANLREGRKADGPTIEWWLSQSTAARESLLQQPRYDRAVDFVYVLEQMMLASHLDPIELHVWAKPPQFDLEILRSLWSDLRPGRWPAQLKLERDSRSLIDLAKTLGWSDCFPECELEHSAVADAAEQAEQVVRIWRRIAGWSAP